MKKVRQGDEVHLHDLGDAFDHDVADCGYNCGTEVWMSWV